MILICVLYRYGWDDQYYEYDESTGDLEAQGWIQDQNGDWHQVNIYIFY
jgi:hypothetical protein